MAYIVDIVIVNRYHRRSLCYKRGVRVSQGGRFQNASREVSSCARKPNTCGGFSRRVVSAEGVKPDPEDCAQDPRLDAPEEQLGTESFLGFANYYRDFIPFHTSKVQPMQELLKKNQHFHWKEGHQEAFDAVKRALAEATALAAPN